ncbi:MAG TPA: hypothetical protein VGJ82_08910, partial [Thermoanaerobaculia bacterium]
ANLNFDRFPVFADDDMDCAVSMARLQPPIQYRNVIKCGRYCFAGAILLGHVIHNRSSACDVLHLR